MYIDCNNKSEINRLMLSLKKMNKEYVDLEEKYIQKGKFRSLLRYLKSGEVDKIIKRLRVWFAEKKSRRKEGKSSFEGCMEVCNYFSNYEVIVYTAIYGGYDIVKEPVFIPDNCKFVIFTDRELPRDSVWEKRDFHTDFFDTLTNAQKNRYIKMHPHLLFDDTEYSVYVDGSMRIITDLTEMVNRISVKGIAIHIHSSRNDVYDELNTNVAYGKLDKKQANEYLKLLKSEKMPIGYGMLECGIIARQNHNNECIGIMEKWWDIYYNCVGRDQLALPLVLYKKGIKITDIGTLGKDIYHNDAIRIIQHLK